MKSTIKYPCIWDAQKDEPGSKRTSVKPRKYPRRYVPSSFYCGHEFSELSVMFGSPPNCEPAEDIMPCIGCPCCCDMIDDPAERGPEPLAGLPEAPRAFVDGFFFLGFCRPSRFACSRASLRPQLLSRNTSAYRATRPTRIMTYALQRFLIPDSDFRHSGLQFAKICQYLRSLPETGIDSPFTSTTLHTRFHSLGRRNRNRNLHDRLPIFTLFHSRDLPSSSGRHRGGTHSKITCR